MRTLDALTHGPEETQALGRLLGAKLAVGDVVLLHGTLGSGKTTLTQGIAWGAGVTGYAHSPTFVLVHEYAGRLFTLYHLDLYRMDDGALEVQDLGFDEMCAQGACVVEWAERASETFPLDRLAVTMEERGGPDDRALAFEARGERYERLLAELAGEIATAARGA
jgi:tRNA threonylcarbamoyladenosine biosynthesis protein TsaE